MQPNTKSREGQALTISVDEAAELAGISRGSAYRAIHTGDIKSVRLGHRILIPRAPFFAMFGIEDPSEGV